MYGPHIHPAVSHCPLLLSIGKKPMPSLPLLPVVASLQLLQLVGPEDALQQTLQIMLGPAKVAHRALGEGGDPSCQGLLAANIILPKPCKRLRVKRNYG